jgi:hypothetical protein
MAGVLQTGGCAVISEPLYSAASTTTPSVSPLMVLLRMGKLWGVDPLPSGNPEIAAHVEQQRRVRVLGG